MKTNDLRTRPNGVPGRRSPWPWILAVGGCIIVLLLALRQSLIRDEQDINRAIKCFAVIAGILAICMVNEQISGQNIFGLLGGVRSVPEIRDGRIRSQAIFEHPILAGTFGATLLPSFFWQWKSGKAKFLAMIGVLSAVTSPDWRPRSVVAWLGVAPVVVLTYFTAEWAWEAIVSPQRGYRISQAAFSGARILVALVLMLPIVATAVAVRVLLGGAQ